MLTVSGLKVSIANAPILRGLSFAIAAGETVALVGRNGAGKTTTLRAIMGLAPLGGGAIQFEGAELTEVQPHLRPALGIGYAPEDRRLFSAFTIEENILLPAQVARLSPPETARRLERAYSILPELKDLAARPAGSVSGGQGKMVALARALMLGTRLVFLDEPFQGLAPALARSYGEALARLRDLDPQLSMLITESNPALLRRFAGRSLLIERGEIAA